MAKMKAGPVVSDNSNFIIDAPFSQEIMKDPTSVSNQKPSLNVVVLTYWDSF